MVSGDGESQELRDRAVVRWEHLQRNWRRRARRNKRTSKLYTYGTVLLSVAVTAMSGVPAVPRWLIVIAGAGAALTAALMGATRSHEQWTLSREIQNRLYAERFLFEQGAGSYEQLGGDEQTRLFSVRITEIGMAGHNSWASHVGDAAALKVVTGPELP